MSQNAETKSRPRRRKSSGLLTSSLLIGALSVAGVYCIWGDAPLERTWTQLGFGKQTPAERASADAPVPRAPRVNVVENMEFPGQESGGDEFAQSTSMGEPGSPTPKFLPESRRRNNIAQKSDPIVDEASVSAGLDDRFEQKNLSQNTASIRTAAFPDAFSRDTFTPKSAPEQARERVRPNVPRSPVAAISNGYDDLTEIQLLAGDRPVPSAAAKRPPRPNLGVSATPANSPANAKLPSVSSRLDLNAIQEMIAAGDDLAAYEKLSEAYFHHPSQRPMFQNQLDEVAQRIYFSPQTQVQPPYEIQPGDQLRKIANKYQLSWQYLSRLNQVDARKIRPGKKLKVFQGPFEARVDLSDFELTILLNGKYVKRYHVGTGKMNTTPIGDFTVLEKLENPTYYGPDGMVLQPDDPQNPLGERWIDIGNSFGIHGTIEPDSIGKSESAGCVRMRNEEVAEVYDLLTIGSAVRIQR